MTRNVKIAVIAGSILATGLLAGFVIYPAIMRRLIRKRLDEAYADPHSEAAAGGMDKLLVNESFDVRKFNASTSKATISRLEARERAKQVWDNYSYWMGSDATAIISAFNGLGHLDDVSKIAYEFQQSYGYELLSILKTALPNKADYNLLIGKLSKLPKE